MRNDSLLQKNISEVKIQLKKFLIIDDKGQEFLIKQFNSRIELVLKGMHNGLFIKIKKPITLPAGRYNSIRFYIDNEESEFIYKDKRSQAMNKIQKLDFYIENALHLECNEHVEIVLRFDLTPFQSMNYFNAIREAFKFPCQLFRRKAFN